MNRHPDIVRKSSALLVALLEMGSPKWTEADKLVMLEVDADKT
jgi:hypothetical protein